MTLYRAGLFGNGACVIDVAHDAGISEGSVVTFTNRCIEAVRSLHDVTMHKMLECWRRPVWRRKLVVHCFEIAGHWRWHTTMSCLDCQYLGADMLNNKIYTR